MVIEWVQLPIPLTKLVKWPAGGLKGTPRPLIMLDVWTYLVP